MFLNNLNLNKFLCGHFFDLDSVVLHQLLQGSSSYVYWEIPEMTSKQKIID